MAETIKTSKTMVTNLTEGSVPKLLFTFAAPLFVSNALQAIYNIVDMVVVGRIIGGTGMSAVATGGNILMILNFVIMGFASAGQIIIAREVGEKNMEAVRHTIGTMFSVLLTASVVISSICYLLRYKLLDLVNTPSEAYQYTMDYTIVCIMGLIFIYGYNTVSAIMRGMGDSKRPFMFVAIASVMNMVLDILFVAVLGLEVRGAALATVIGQAFSFLYAIFYLYKHKESFGFDFKPASFVPDPQAFRKLCALGIPMAIQSAAVNLSMTVVAAWVNSFGVVASACAGILNKLNMMVGILSNAITTAAGSMVGQNLGARKFKRVPQILLWAVLMASVIEAIFVVMMLTVPNVIFTMFTKDVEIITSASIIILPSIVNAFGAISRCFGFGIINGSGNSKLNLLVAILDGLIARILLAYIFGWSMGMGPQGFWMGDAVAGFMPFVIGGIFYLRGSWRK